MASIGEDGDGDGRLSSAAASPTNPSISEDQAY
jgi:hypothetical protein